MLRLRRWSPVIVLLLPLSLWAAEAAVPIKESSGLAVAGDGTVWANSDGPNPGGKQDRSLYAFQPDGTFVRSALLNVRNSDWEDMAAFTEKGQRYFLIADTGDNSARRADSRLYIVEQPTGAEAKIAWKIIFRYADQPHDVEAVAVDLPTNRVLLLTKRDDPPGIYALALHGDERQVATRVGTLWALPRSSLMGVVFHPLLASYAHEPTGFDIAPDHRSAVVLTYRRAYLWRRNAGEAWETVLGREPDFFIPLPDIAQYEGVAFAPDGRSIYVSQEGNATLEQVPLPPH